MNDFTDIVDGGTHRRNLNKHFAAVPVVFDHRADGLHMSDRTVHAV